MLLELEKEQGFTPLALKKRVTLKRGLRKYRDMFRDLSSQRIFNEAGVQSIQIEAIESYLDIDCEFRPEHRKLARRLMLDLDAVFMAHVRKKMEKK